MMLTPLKEWQHFAIPDFTILFQNKAFNKDPLLSK
jgi:hypothetical protein